MSVVIPVRVPRDLATKINEMIIAGLYSSRSHLVRESLRRFMVSERTFAHGNNIRRVAATLSSTIISWNEKAVTDIILFGSTARGEATVESDVDLLILVKNVKPWIIRRRLYDLIYPLIPVLGVNISLITMDKERFTLMAKERNSFAVSIINEGVQLHGDFLNEYSRGSSEKGSRKVKSR